MPPERPFGPFKDAMDVFSAAGEKFFRKRVDAMMKKFPLIALLLCTLALLSCTAYKSREVSFRPPSAYPGMQVVDGAEIAAQGYANPDEAKKAFGFNIRGAGLLPVQVIIDNKSSHDFSIVPDQTFLIDAKGNYWNLLDRRTAYERVEKSNEFANIAGGAGKGSLLGAAGGAIVGAAIGILSGQNVGAALGKGAAFGAAGGAVIGGAQAGTSGEAGRTISRDLATKQLENRTIQPGMLTRGFLFFPGEAPSAAKLRLQVRENDTGKVVTLTLPVAP